MRLLIDIRLERMSPGEILVGIAEGILDRTAEVVSEKIQSDAMASRIARHLDSWLESTEEFRQAKASRNRSKTSVSEPVVEPVGAPAVDNPAVQAPTSTSAAGPSDG